MNITIHSITIFTVNTISITNTINITITIAITITVLLLLIYFYQCSMNIDQ